MRRVGASNALIALAFACTALLAGGCSDHGGAGAAAEAAAADIAAAQELGIELITVADPPLGGPAPVIADALASSLAERRCLVIEPAPEGQPGELELPPRGAAIEAPADTSVALRLRRSAGDSYPVALGTVAAGEEAMVRIPATPGPPWQPAVTSQELLSVCGLER